MPHRNKTRSSRSKHGAHGVTSGLVGKPLSGGRSVITHSAFILLDSSTTCCLTVKVERVVTPKGPVAGATVWVAATTGGIYSSGVTDSQGHVCLVAAMNSPIEITAYAPSSPTFPVGVTATAPNLVSGIGDCGNSTKCPLIATVQIDF